jgi:hypothetical protein
MAETWDIVNREQIKLSYIEYERKGVKHGHLTPRNTENLVMVHLKESETCGFVAYHAELKKLFCGGCFKYLSGSTQTLFYVSECVPYARVEDRQVLKLLRSENG